MYSEDEGKLISESGEDEPMDNSQRSDRGNQDELMDNS